MLTDEQYEAMGDGVAAPFYQLEKTLVQRIAVGLARLAQWLETAGVRAAALRAGGVTRSRARLEARLALAGDKAYRAALAQETGEYRREVTLGTREALQDARGTAVSILPLAALAAQRACKASAMNSVPVSRASPDSGRAESASVIVRGAQGVRRVAREEQSEPGKATGERGAPLRADHEAETGEASAAIESIATEAANVAAGELGEIVRSSAFRVNGADTPLSRTFQKAVDDALARMLAGDISIDEAVRQTVGDLAAGGMRAVTYSKSGKAIVTHTDVAVRRCLQTAAAQTAARTTMESCRRMGVNHVEVSAHWGARTDGSGGHGDHQAWQGRVYQIDGSSAAYPNLEEKTGYPSDPLGLCGYNCRHSMYPFWPGFSTQNSWEKEPAPKEWRKGEYTYYEATQRMRLLERKIRTAKRRAFGEEAAGGESLLKGRIERLKDEYRDFCKAMSIRPAWNRTTIEGEKPDFKRIFEP